MRCLGVCVSIHLESRSIEVFQLTLASRIVAIGITATSIATLLLHPISPPLQAQNDSQTAQQARNTEEASGSAALLWWPVGSPGEHAEPSPGRRRSAAVRVVVSFDVRFLNPFLLAETEDGEEAVDNALAAETGAE